MCKGKVESCKKKYGSYSKDSLASMRHHAHFGNWNKEKAAVKKTPEYKAYLAD